MNRKLYNPKTLTKDLEVKPLYLTEFAERAITRIRHYFGKKEPAIDKELVRRIFNYDERNTSLFGLVTGINMDNDITQKINGKGLHEVRKGIYVLAPNLKKKNSDYK